MNKKKLTLLAITGGALMLLAVTAFAGNYHGPMGGYGYGPCAFGPTNYGPARGVAPENRGKVSKLAAEYRAEMARLNDRLIRKSAELKRIYADPKTPEQKKAKIESEIASLREQVVKEKTVFQNKLAGLTGGQINRYGGYAGQRNRARYSGCW